MIAAETAIAKKTLKFKITSSQRIEGASATRSCELGQQLTNGWGHSTYVDENHHSQMSKSQNLNQKFRVSGANKRGPSGLMEVQPEKRLKMDRGVTQQCSALVKNLMRHPAGWVFNQPVDPVELNIPDYFSIIKNPMDLGTIKSKLEKNLYGSPEEFVADVKLTFSNAMLYNPPTNNVHKMAEELNGIFEVRWKTLEEKLNCEISKFGNGKLLSGWMKETSDTKQECPKTAPLCNVDLPKRSKPSEEKMTRSSLSARVEEVKLAKPAENCLHKSLEQNFRKGTDSGGRHAHGSVNVKPPMSPASKCRTCGRSACQCSLHSDSTHASSDISSERSSGRDHHVCSTDVAKLDCQAKSTSTSQMSKSDPDSDGAVSALDDENICPSSQLTTPASDATSGGWRPPVFDVQLSPTKALRAAMLKQRFADTILKAQHKTLLDHGDKTDLVKMQQEKERLERRQREEKARIEAQIKAAEAASRMREEIELKRQREREREAARVALQKMEKTVEIEQNLETLKELEMLSGGSLSYNFHHDRAGAEVVEGENGGVWFGSPLERLGLFMKDDSEDEDEEILNGDGEEGEILY